MTPDELYHLDYYRAMEAAYKQQTGLETITVYKIDKERFTALCERWGYTPQQMFHSLLKNG